MVAYNKFQQFVQDLCNKKHDCSGDTFKVMLTNSAPVATNSVFGDLTEISAGNGYSAGGSAATGNVSTQSSGTETFTLHNITFTASGGTIGPFRYFVLYNSTQTSPNKPLVAWWDYGSNLTLNAGDSFTVQWNGGGSSGSVFTLA